MRIIEITALSNGAHRNQTPNQLSRIPEGWAVIPNSMETPSFPFGDITVEEVNGVPTVTSWTPGVVPETDLEQPEPETEVSTADMAAAILEGVNDV